MEELREILTLRLEDVMEEIKTLEDAYDFVNKLENSEVNAAFKILMNGFVKQKERHTFFTNAITVHLARLTDFSKNYGDSTWRKSIVAK
jgi:hypothetical protein